MKQKMPKAYKDASPKERDRISAIVGYAVAQVMKETVENTAQEVINSVKAKQDFESIRRLVANQQKVHGNTVQLQAIYELCNENI